MGAAWVIRRLQGGDVEPIVALVEATAAFRPAEVAIARELLEAGVADGDASGYRFHVLDAGGRVRGYACFGPTPGTEGTWDLYWIVTAPEAERQGVASAILARLVEELRREGARLLVAETSDTAAYARARGFYGRSGFREAARIPHYYKPGDGLVILILDLREDGVVRSST